MVRQEIEFAGAGKHPGDPDSAALWPRDADSLSGAGLLPGNQLWPLMIPTAFAEAVEPVAHARPLAAYD